MLEYLNTSFVPVGPFFLPGGTFVRRTFSFYVKQIEKKLIEINVQIATFIFHASCFHFSGQWGYCLCMFAKKKNSS